MTRALRLLAGLALALLPGLAQAGACGVPGPGTVVRDVEVFDGNSGRVVHRGDIDLGPTLRRIEAGQASPVGRGDGTAFCARGLDRRVFDEPAYAEFVVTPTFLRGRSPGPQRLVVGTRSGRAFYSCDHYQSFVEIAPRVALPPDRVATVEAEARQQCRRR